MDLETEHKNKLKEKVCVPHLVCFDNLKSNK